MKIVSSLVVSVLLFVGLVTPVLAAPVQSVQQPEFAKAKVLSINEQGTKEINGSKNRYQKISVQILDGKDKGKNLTIESGLQTTLTPSQIVEKGQTIVLIKIAKPDQKAQYQVYDSYRVDYLIYIFAAFFVVVVAIAGWKGFGSIVGLSISLAIIFVYIVPQILGGADPLTVSIYGSLAILFLTMYLSHGISKQTTVALLATFIALMLSAGFAILFVDLANLSGFNEETATLQYGATAAIQLKGLLLAGIIIGALGAIDDITTTQTAAIFELSKIDKNLSFKELFAKGFVVGREHVASMVNTLALAYTGSSLALFLFLILNPQNYPWWVILNGEDVGGEIVRTLAGSMGLVLVVPIVTFLAAVVCNQEVKRALKQIFHSLK